MTGSYMTGVSIFFSMIGGCAVLTVWIAYHWRSNSVVIKAAAAAVLILYLTGCYAILSTYRVASAPKPDRPTTTSSSDFIILN